MLKKILLAVLGLAILLIAFVAIAAFVTKSDYSVERQVTINRPKAEVFPYIKLLKNQNEWGPWAKKDPAIKQEYRGTDGTVGFVSSWDGNDEVGAGKMTIVDSKPGELVKIKLEFFRPFESQADTQFTFKPDGDQTMVTWTMTGQHNFIGKAMCLVMNMDKMLGAEFDKGLAQMNAAVQADKKKEPEPAN